MGLKATLELGMGQTGKFSQGDHIWAVFLSHRISVDSFG
jgi:hypothetical protein